MLKTPIPFVDLRGKPQADLLRAYPDKAHALIGAARRTHGVLSLAASYLALPVADRISHYWLKRQRNPYLHEIETSADILNVGGVYALNLSYEWCCTTGAYATDEGVTMLRVLDWRTPLLGKHVVVVLQEGSAGKFYNLTWPGMAGMTTGMAPGRFSAALNQAPMCRHGLGFAVDWIKNRLRWLIRKDLPPGHLLRLVFEQCKSYAEAKKMLSETPIAMPAIFTLTGVKPGEGCVIERLEDAVQLREISAQRSVSACNHFLTDFAAYGKGWVSRGTESEARHAQSCSIFAHDIAQNHFDWLRAPIVNSLTRLVVIADSGSGRLVAQGFEGPTAVTEMYERPGALAKKPLEEVM